MRSEKKMHLRLVGRKAFSLGLPVLVLAMTASASNVTTITPPGSSTAGPVAAKATFITGNGFVNITLTDLEVNPSNASQLLSGLSFTLSNGATTGTLFSSMGTHVTVNTGGTYSVGSSGAAGWGLNNNVSGGLQLNALGYVGPAGLIIGSSGAGGTYSNANSSIAGNPAAHNPFLLNSMTFIVDIASVTSTTTVTSSTFLFGTTPGQFKVLGTTPGQFNVQGCVSTDPSCGLSSVPEPVSLVLTGSGLIGLLFLRRRRI